jgi:hypothetical protein
MIYLVTLWVALGIAVLAMAMYRKYLSRNEDDMLHLSPGTERMVRQQRELDSQLTWIDRWGIPLTVVEVLFGLVLASVWLYKAWIENN